MLFNGGVSHVQRDVDFIRETPYGRGLWKYHHFKKGASSPKHLCSELFVCVCIYLLRCVFVLGEVGVHEFLSEIFKMSHE